MGLGPHRPWFGNLTRSGEAGHRGGSDKTTGGSDDGKTRLTSEGITYPQYEGMPCIGYSAGKRIGGDRQRFTKAHELGHLILHGSAGPIHRSRWSVRRICSRGRCCCRRRHVALHPEERYVKRLPQSQIGLGSINCRFNQSGPYVGHHQRRTVSFLADPIVQPWMAQTGTRQCGGGASAAAQADDPGRFRSRLKHRRRAGDQFLRRGRQARHPVRYLDCWSDGLVEEGMEFGFVEDRIESSPATVSVMAWNGSAFPSAECDRPASPWDA